MIQDLGMVRDSSGGRQELRGNIQHRIFASYLRLALSFFFLFCLYPLLFLCPSSSPSVRRFRELWPLQPGGTQRMHVGLKINSKGRPAHPSSHPPDAGQPRFCSCVPAGSGKMGRVHRPLDLTLGPRYPHARYVRENRNHQDMEGPGRT